MAYTSGIASNYKDLLAVLATFAAANGHVILEQDDSHIMMRGEGLNGLDNIFWGIRTYEDTINSRFNWDLFGSLVYRPGRDFGDQPISSGAGKTFIYLWNNAIPYWFAGDARHMRGVVKVGTVYQAFYIGLGLPNGTDAQLPYPLIVGGMGIAQNQNFSATGTGHSFFLSRSTTSNSTIDQFGALLIPGNIWYPINRQPGSNVVNAEWANLNINAQILTSPDGEYLLDEIWLRAGITVRNTTIWSLICAVDGFFAITGYNNTSENVVTANGVNYLVFQDAYRTGYGDYFAMRMA